MKKVREELKELDEELKLNRSKKRMEEEMGDFLFSVVQIARHLGLDAERSLRGSAQKFSNRFDRLENQLAKKGKKISDLKPAELEKAWQAIKKEKKN